MATMTPVADSKVAPRPTLIPPEEKFWQRYSPHQEAPLSGVSSTLLHILFIGLLLGVIWLNDRLNPEDDNRPIPVDPVRFALPPGGGGGNPSGVGSGAGTSNPSGEDDPEEGDEIKKEPPPDLPKHEDLRPPKEGILKVLKDDPAATNWIQHGAPPNFNSISQLHDDTIQVLRKTVNPRAGKGQGGSGKDDGKDSGTGKGSGKAAGKGGPTKGELSQREKRVARWNMIFSTLSGRDYLNQLHSLGAIVGVPVDGKEGEFTLIRDLTNPASARVEDVSALDRIYWIDDKQQSVHSLFSVLPQFKEPPYFVAFFPYTLEKRLLVLELAYTSRKYGMTDEDKIHETKFDVYRVSGGYDVRVSAVYLRR